MICGDPVKDWIIDYLSLQVTAPIKAVYLGLQDAGHTLSQAQVYNIVNSMLKAKMLTKKSGKVRLSAWWIESIEEIVSRLHQQRDRDGIALMCDGEKKVFEAKTFHELNAIWHDVSSHILTHYTGDVYYYDPHPYHLLGEYGREQKDLLLGKKEQAQLYYVIGGNTFLDQYGAGLAQKQGVYVVTTKNSPFSGGEFWAVVGEYLYQVVLDKNVVAYLDMFFETVPSLDLFRQDLFYDLFALKGSFTLTLWRDKLYADEYKNRIRSLFQDATYTVRANSL